MFHQILPLMMAVKTILLTSTLLLAASYGLVDEVVDPRSTREALCRALDMLSTKRGAVPRRKHGNIPL